MAAAKRKATGRKKAARRGGESNPKINEFEIWSKYAEQMSKLVAREVERASSLAAAMKPGKSSYSLGDFLQDQLKISSKLLAAYLEASKTA